MSRDSQTAAIMSAGMKLLRDNLGVFEAEIFVSHIARNDFDYTKWRENLWQDSTPEELFERAARTEETYDIPAGVEIL